MRCYRHILGFYCSVTTAGQAFILAIHPWFHPIPLFTATMLLIPFCFKVVPIHFIHPHNSRGFFIGNASLTSHSMPELAISPSLHSTNSKALQPLPHTVTIRYPPPLPQLMHYDAQMFPMALPCCCFPSLPP